LVDLSAGGQELGDLVIDGFRMLPLLKSLLEADFPGIEVLPIDAFPQGNAVIGSEETAALVKASGVDAVIIGNAA